MNPEHGLGAARPPTVVAALQAAPRTASGALPGAGGPVLRVRRAAAIAMLPTSARGTIHPARPR